MADKKYMEFWIEKFNGRNPCSYYAHIKKPDALSMVRIKINDGDPIAASEYFKVIETQAVTDLEAKLAASEKMCEALVFDRDNLSMSFFKLQQSASNGMIALEERHTDALKMLEELAAVLDYTQGSEFYYESVESQDKITLALESYRKFKGVL